MLILKFAQALRVVNLETGQSKLAAADTAGKSSRFLDLFLVSLLDWFDIGLFGTGVEVDLQTFLIEGPAAELARRKDLVLVDLGGLLIVTV